MSKQNLFSIESDILRVHDARVIVSGEVYERNETQICTVSMKDYIWVNN
jgi:hypothetical protein